MKAIFKTIVIILLIVQISQAAEPTRYESGFILWNSGINGYGQNITNATNISAKFIGGVVYAGNGYTIQEAINNGDEVRIPPGNFNIGCTPITLKSNLIIRGSGMGVTKLIKDAGCIGGNGDIIRVVQVYPNFFHHILINGLTLDGTNQAFGGGAYNNGITFLGVENSEISDVEILNPNYFGIVVGTNGGTSPYVSNNIFKNIHINSTNIPKSPDTGLGGDAFGGGGIKSSVFEGIYVNKTNSTGTCVDVTNQSLNYWNKIYCTFYKGVQSGNWGVSADFNVQNTTFENIFVNTIDNNNTEYSVYLGYGSSDNVISNVNSNYAKFNSIDVRGTAASNNKNIVIKGSNLRDWSGTTNNAAIYLYYTNSSIIRENLISPSRNGGEYPIKLEMSYNNTVFHNSFKTSELGILSQNGTATFNNWGLSPYNFGSSSNNISAFGAGDTFFNSTKGDWCQATGAGLQNWHYLGNASWAKTSWC